MSEEKACCAGEQQYKCCCDCSGFAEILRKVAELLEK